MAPLVRSHPGCAEHGVVHWRWTDLVAVIAARLDATLAGRTVGTLLRRLGFVRLSVRLRHPARDAEAHSKYKNFVHLVAAATPESRSEKCRLWLDVLAPFNEVC